MEGTFGDSVKFLSGDEEPRLDASHDVIFFVRNGRGSSVVEDQRRGMEKKKLDIVGKVVVPIVSSVLLVVFGWMVVTVADDFVIQFVMPPMFKAESGGTAPLYRRLDTRYMRRPDENSGVEEQPISINDVREAVKEELRHHLEALHKPDVVSEEAQQATATQKVENVRLYLSTVEGEENLIVLNGSSPRLSQNIRYGALYVVSRTGTFADQNASPLRAELRNLDAPGQGIYAVIGRIPTQHFERLGGRQLGYVDADIHLSSATP